jgi:hypothetical protein
VVERLPYLALVLLCVALMAHGLRRRRASGRASDRAFVPKLAWASIGLSSALVRVIFPASWLFVSFTVYGGTVESNLAPGYSLQVILGSLLAGAVFTGVSAVYGYLEHVDS